MKKHSLEYYIAGFWLRFGFIYDKPRHWYNVVKTVLNQMRRNRAMRQFKKMMADQASGLDQVVGRAAEKRAWAMVMTWLDNKGIGHCRFCPNTDQLRRHLDYYVCVPHWEMVKAKPSTNGKEQDKEKVLQK